MTNQAETNSVEEYQKKALMADLDRWKREIEIINLEIIFYRNLVKSHHKEFSVWSASDYQNLFNGLRDVQYYNEAFQKRYLEFTARLQNFGECDNIPCETFFMKDYEYFKLEIEDHFIRYKDFKKNLYLYLKTRYDY